MASDTDTNLELSDGRKQKGFVRHSVTLLVFSVGLHVGRKLLGSYDTVVVSNELQLQEQGTKQVSTLRTLSKTMEGTVGKCRLW